MKKHLLILTVIIFTAAQLFAVRANIRILATGGGIAGTQTSTKYSVAKLTVTELLKKNPGLNKIANIKGEQISQIACWVDEGSSLN